MLLPQTNVSKLTMEDKPSIPGRKDGKKRENIDLKELYQLYNEIDSYISQRYNELFGLWSHVYSESEDYTLTIMYLWRDYYPFFYFYFAAL